MGLDIVAYKNIVKATGNEAFDETGEIKDEDHWFQLWPNDDYPERASNIAYGCAYKAEDSFHFRAGSYGGYNHWRDKLAEMAGYPKGSYNEYGKEWKSYAASVWNNPKPGPFMELIHFSDCEGILGEEVATRLAADFEQFQEKAETFDDEYFLSKYNDWRKAFELAASNGCVELC